jgi:hypothetical protein
MFVGYYELSYDRFLQAKFRIFFSSVLIQFWARTFLSLSILIQTWSIKHCLYFSFVLPAWRNLFSANGIFCGGRYQPRYTGIFCPSKATGRPITISKKWKNPSSALLRKRTWVQVLPSFFTDSSAYQPRAQISNHGRQALLAYTKFWRRASFTRSTHVCEVLLTFFVTGEIKLSLWCHS